MKYYCNNKYCSYGEEIEDYGGRVKQLPAESYSQEPRSEDYPLHLGYYYYGLCLNCLTTINGRRKYKMSLHEEIYNLKDAVASIKYDMRYLADGFRTGNKVVKVFQKGTGNKWEFGIEKWQFGSEYLNYKTIYFSKHFEEGVEESIDEFSVKFKDWTYVGIFG